MSYPKYRDKWLCDNSPELRYQNYFNIVTRIVSCHKSDISDWEITLWAGQHETPYNSYGESLSDRAFPEGSQPVAKSGGVFFHVFLVPVIGVVLSSIAFGAGIYDPNADFSTISNPNGVWRLGTEGTIGGAITMFSLADPNCTTPGYESWWSSANCITGPFVAKNATGGEFVYSGTGGTLFQQTTELNVVPGDTVFTVVEWTGAVTGNYSIDGFFRGLDIKPTTSDVHILINGVDVFDANIAEFGLKHTFSFSPDLLAGATVDFVVGSGSDHSAQNDSNGLTVTIILNPEPGPAILVPLGGTIFLAIRRRKGR